MHVVRTQLFSLIICSSEVESTHLRGVEKSLALFISQQLREDAFEAAFALENGGFHTCVLQELCGIDKGPTTGKCRFLRLGCHRRKGTGTRTRVRRCRRTQKGKPSRKPGIYPLILSSGTRKRIWALHFRLDFCRRQEGELQNIFCSIIAAPSRSSAQQLHAIFSLR